MERRLTTILAADVAGYSRLMEADEQGTYAALQTHLDDFILPNVEAGNGRIVKLMGDGLLAEFDSVVDAVECALALQRGMAERNIDVSGDARLVLRIGVHLGDVIVKQGDIFGDGVNVAARLEALAEPGAVCISQQVLDQIETKINVARSDLGRCKVKNLSRPIHAYSLDPFGPAELITRRPRRGRTFGLLAAIAACLGIAIFLWQPWTQKFEEPEQQSELRDISALPSLAVLPFENLSGDQQDDYLADGMTDDLVTDLARLSGLVVISRSSTLPYKGQSPEVADVAEDLGAQYVVLGTMRRSGNTLRINAKLVDSETGAHIWAQRYDRDAADLLSLQDDVRSEIVSALQVRFSPEESESISQSKTENPEAYDAYLRARQQESYFTEASTREAIRLYHLALEHDPDFASATARLAIAYTLAVDNGWVADAEEGLELARSLAAQAIAKDPNLPTAYWAMARYYTRDETWDSDKAIEALETAISIDPNYADGYAMLSNTLQFVGRSEEGLGMIEAAMRLNPNFPFWYHFARGANQFNLQRFEEARTSFEKAIERNPGWPSSYRYLISTLGHLGDIDEAEWQIEEFQALGFDLNLSDMEAGTKMQDPVYRERFFEGLRKAGVPEN
ncbi:tetratricopeptide repeat protein [Seohaeicola saemankumensis]|nr:adenylate/guanylate cyclase domain-containing protein [Seohaeicola saemankumensis]MCA0869962.1 tetratricopeptide repeat protein [Seohaeicola saemankumensis]